MDTPLSHEKPKVEELQMDWLRSEDLKEEKVLTTSLRTVTRQRRLARPKFNLETQRTCEPRVATSARG